MTRKILVELDITRATDTHCEECSEWSGNCPWAQRRSWHRDGGFRRHPDCIAAEKAIPKEEPAPTLAPYKVSLSWWNTMTSKGCESSAIVFTDDGRDIRVHYYFGGKHCEKEANEMAAKLNAEHAAKEASK